MTRANRGTPLSEGSGEAPGTGTEMGKLYSPHSAKAFASVEKGTAESAAGESMGKLYSPSSASMTLTEKGGGDESHAKEQEGEGSDTVANIAQQVKDRLLQQLVEAPHVGVDAATYARESFERFARDTAEVASKAEEVARWMRAKLADGLARISPSGSNNDTKTPIPAGRSPELEKSARRIEAEAERETAPGHQRFSQHPPQTGTVLVKQDPAVEHIAERIEAEAEQETAPGNHRLSQWPAQSTNASPNMGKDESSRKGARKTSKTVAPISKL